MRMRSVLVMGMPLRSALSTRLSSAITLWTTPKDAMDMGRVAGLSQGLVEYGFQHKLGTCVAGFGFGNHRISQRPGQGRVQLDLQGDHLAGTACNLMASKPHKAGLGLGVGVLMGMGL